MDTIIVLENKFEIRNAFRRLNNRLQENWVRDIDILRMPGWQILGEV